jgi:hypothetical protein
MDESSDPANRSAARVTSAPPAAAAAFRSRRRFSMYGVSSMTPS